MPPGWLNKLQERTKHQRAVLDQLSKPIRYAVTAFSLLATAYHFWITYGLVSLPVAGLIGVGALFLLLAVPAHGIRIFALRALAFLADLLFLGAVTGASLFLVRPYLPWSAAPTLMVTVWLWFCYFVFFDWRFGATPGMYFFGLRLLCVEEKAISLANSLIRGFSGLLAPVVGASLALDAVLSHSRSTTRFFLADTLYMAVLCLVPISIVILGGHQGIVDALGAVIVETRTDKPSIVSPWNLVKTLPGIFLFSLAFGALVACLIPITFGGSPFARTPTNRDIRNVVGYRAVDNAEHLGYLWQFLPLGIKHPTSIIRNIELREMQPNPFEFSPLDSDFAMGSSPNPANDLQNVHSMLVARVSLSPYTTSLAKTHLMQNFGSAEATRTPLSRRPSFVVLDFVTVDDFGLFNVAHEENTLLCMMPSGEEGADFFVDVKYGQSFTVHSSLDEIRLLLLGRLDLVEALIAKE
jgi:uncharacterized RDD family membrane protein YckC